MQTIGKYEILEQLGGGSMGTVYRARDPILGREVALKTLRLGPHVDPETKERFYREARVCASLQHPNIVAVFDVNESEGVAYIAMEFLSGSDWAKIISRRDRFPASLAIEAMAQVCDGLGHAHRNGVIHRDLKPSNLFLVDGTRAKILDFGIARLSSSQLTVQGRVLGTPNYMAPEQIRGQACDTRSDLFSAAVVFFEFAAGLHPFQSRFIPSRIADGDPEDLFVAAPDMPVALGQVLEQGMAKDPDARFQTAEEMAAALRAIIQPAEPVAAAEEHTGPVLVVAAPPMEDAADSRLSEFIRLLHDFDAALQRGAPANTRSLLSQIQRLAEVDERFKTPFEDCATRFERAAAPPPPPAPPRPLAEGPAGPLPPRPAAETLALLYQGVLTSVVRVQSGRQPISDIRSFRKRMKDALQEIEREAAKLRYTEPGIRAAHCAVVSYLDETVLQSGDPNHDEWTPLEAEIFGEDTAQPGFYEQLEALQALPDSHGLGDVLEVFYLTLLLGYRGHYANDPAKQLPSLLNELQQRIERIRGSSERFAPETALPAFGTPPPRPAGTNWLRRITLAAGLSALLAAVSWGVFRLLLGLMTESARTAIEGSLTR